MPVNLLNEKDLNNYLSDIVYHGDKMETFKSGDFKSTAFVEQNKDAIVRSMLLQWCKHRLRAYLAEDLPEHKAFLTEITKAEPDLPSWAEHCLAEGKPIHRFNADLIPASLTENITTIRDYLYSAAESYINKTLARIKDTNAKEKDKEKASPKLRIDYLKTHDSYDTFEKTLNEAKKWHEIMAEKATLKKRNEKMYQASLSGTKEIMKLKDDMRIVRLTTPEALDYESEYMGHCVGKGGYDSDVQKGTTIIYSLRDENDMPHATFEVRVNEDTNKEEIHQCKGKGNKAPVKRYFPYIQEFVLDRELEIVGDTKNTGLIKLYDEDSQTSQYYDMYNIPKDKKLICKGTLDLRNMDLTELPDLSNVIVEGSFDCSDNQLTSLEGCPKEVKKDFFCSHNQLTSLEGAPQKVHDFYCSDNQLTSLEGCPKEVRGDFDCSNNQLTSLEGAPQEVGRSFDCSYNQLTSLKGTLQKVGGSFDCSDNQLTSLVGAPQEVGGSFNCLDNRLTSLEGVPREVGGSFDCSINQLISLEGAPQKVGGSFICSDNPLSSPEKDNDQRKEYIKELSQSVRYKIKRKEAAKNISPLKGEIKPKRSGKSKIIAKINITWETLKQRFTK